MKQFLLAGMIVVWAGGAFAHSPLQKTTPEHQSVIAEAPDEIMMDFKGGIRLTRVSLKREDGDSVDLDLTGFDGFLSQYSIPLQSHGAGAYKIEWRGLGTDGHTMTGAFSFSVE